MKHSKWIAALATAGGLVAMSGAAHAIAPAAAIGLAALGGAAVGSAAAQASAPPAVAVYPANPTVVMGGPPAVQVIEGPSTTTYVESNGSTVWVPAGQGPINYDHDGDGVLNLVGQVRDFHPWHRFAAMSRTLDAAGASA